MKLHSISTVIWVCIAITVMGLCLMIGAVVFSVKQTITAMHQARNFEFETAAQTSRSSLPVAKVLSALTAGKSTDIEIWKDGLLLISELPNAIAQFSPFTTDNPGVTTGPTTSQLSRDLASLMSSIQQRWWFKRWATAQAPVIQKQTQVLHVLNEQLLTGKHRYLVVFQNSDELRATGGFMGSYAELALQDGQVSNVEIQDIYVPDGQFNGFVEAPPGLHEYLSGGRGLRLPDANWWADFPTSAQKMLPFFALGKQQSAEGVIAVNLDVMKHLLQITGPIYLPDYLVTVTADNISEVARADRSSFFPGSVAKPQFLSALFTQLKIKLNDLSADQKKQLLEVVKTDIQTKNLQFYSNDQALQQVFIDNNMAGTLELPSDMPTMMVVESNVGINKANQAVNREVNVAIQPSQTTITIQLHNHNPASLENGGRYVNYQRLLIPTDTTVTHITVGDQELQTWDSDIVVTSQGLRLQQVGFLVVVGSQADQTITFELTHPIYEDGLQLLVQKQSGLPATPYTLSWQGKTQSLLLEKNEVVHW